MKIKLDIKKIIGSPICASCILSLIYIISVLRINSTPAKTINIWILFEILLFVLFSLIYFYVFKTNMDKSFIKTLALRYFYFMFVAMMALASFDQIFSTYYGIIHQLYEIIIGMPIVAILYALPAFIICIVSSPQFLVQV